MPFIELLSRTVEQWGPDKRVIRDVGEKKKKARAFERGYTRPGAFHRCVCVFV